MKNSDFIQMHQCRLYSVKFPSDNLKEVLEQAEFEKRTPFIEFSLVKNPMTGTKVHVLENGVFFTARVLFKKLTRDLLTAKIGELKQKLDSGEFEFALFPDSERKWKELATELLYRDVPYSSELINVFYCSEKELLIINSDSKRGELTVSHLIELFGLSGFRSIVVSDEKLGLNTKLTACLESGAPMFRFLNFEYEATLRKQEGDDEAFLMCRHLETDEGRAKALEALRGGFTVQSMLMRYDDGLFPVNFKIDRKLKIRSMKFTDYAETARLLNSPKFARKDTEFIHYLNCQLDALLKIANDTVLEFVSDTQLEGFL